MRKLKTSTVEDIEAALPKVREASHEAVKIKLADGLEVSGMENGRMLSLQLEPEKLSKTTPSDRRERPISKFLVNGVPLEEFRANTIRTRHRGKVDLKSDPVDTQAA